MPEISSDIQHQKAKKTRSISLNQFTLRAAWVFPVATPPIRNGAIVIVDGRVAEVGPAKEVLFCGPVFDLGMGAVIPGLVNAHTHLEFSGLKNPLGKPGIEFCQWIRLVIEHRRCVTYAMDKMLGITGGANECFENGTWLIGEIATSPMPFGRYRDEEVKPTIVPMLERLGRDTSKFGEQLTELNEHLSRELTGASPHAPYSTHPSLVQPICEMAREKNRVVAMHLAETKSELELLSSLSGNFVAMLQELGVWDAERFEPRWSIMDFLRELSKSSRSIVVHGNYLTDVELDFIQSKRSRMSIAFCPRTHQYFEHAPYPLEKMLAREICVCVGTDSRASNPDLNLWKELTCIRADFPGLDPLTVLRLGTLNGAFALGCEQDFGSIKPGTKAALSFVSTKDGQKLDPDCLFEDTVCKPVEIDSERPA